MLGNDMPSRYLALAGKPAVVIIITHSHVQHLAVYKSAQKSAHDLLHIWHTANDLTTCMHARRSAHVVRGLVTSAVAARILYACILYYS